MNPGLKQLFLASLALGFSTVAARADDAVLKPFVLASKSAGSIAEQVATANAALLANGFAIVGSYAPYPDTTIIVVTNDEMKNTAAKSEHGGFGAIQRISVTKIKDQVQVSYTNPQSPGDCRGRC